MSAVRELVPVACLGLCACEATTPTQVVVPESAAWVAALRIDAEGARILDASALKPVSEGFRLSNDRESLDVHLIAYSSERLKPFTAPQSPENVVTDDRLTETFDCVRPLPHPEWALVVHPDDTFESAEFPPNIRLSAPWAHDDCPSGEPLDLIHSDECRPSTCSATLTQTGCTVRLDRQCALPDLEFRILPDGSSCGAPTEGCTSERVNTPNVLGRFTCQETEGKTCRVDAYVHRPLVSFDVERVRVQEGPMPEIPALGPWRRSGYIFGAVDLGDAIIIGVSPTARDLSSGCGAQPTRLLRIDPETLEVTSTADGPRCAQALTDDVLNPDRFVVIEANGLNLEFSRHNKDLTETSEGSVRFPLSSGASLSIIEAGWNDDHGLLNVLALEGEGVRLALFQNDFTLDDAFRADREVGALEPSAGSFAFVSTEHDSWALDLASRNFDPSAFRTFFRSPKAMPQPLSAEDATWIPGAQMAAIALTGAAPRLAFVPIQKANPDREILADIAVIYDPALHPSTLAAWPNPLGDAWGVVALTSTKVDRTTQLALFDPIHSYVLPDPTPIGAGPVSHLWSDSRGRIWAALSWTGELVRLTPKF